MSAKPLHLLLFATILLLGLTTTTLAEDSDKPALEKLAGEWVLEKVNGEAIDPSVVAKFNFKDIDTLEIVVTVEEQVVEESETRYEATAEGKLVIFDGDDAEEGTWEVQPDGKLYLLSETNGEKESLTMRRI